MRLEDELMMEIKKRAQKENVSLSKMVNRLLRRGLQASKRDGKTRRPYRQRVFSMGVPTIDLDKVMAVATSLEDEEILRKISLRNEDR
jgi:hypothetical protein